MAQCKGVGQIVPEVEGGTGFAGQMLGRMEVECPVCKRVYYDWDEELNEPWEAVCNGVYMGKVPAHDVKAAVA